MGIKIGARYFGDGRCEFIVWAPFLKKVEVKIISSQEKILSMERDTKGYWKTTVDNVFPGASYLYSLENERERPDPASHFQPKGVHSPSEVVDHSIFDWEDGNRREIPLSEMIMYEIHAGTFTPEGTFDAIVQRLDNLRDMGINAIELMPVSQFPGERNWGYDGTYPFAVQNSYGGPENLKLLVNECHKKDMAVILDVIYNHLGSEGNYLWDFGPYFTDKYKTPWGNAMNFDDAYSNEVRNFFVANALHWFENYHIDALRLDAVHNIKDMSAKPFLQELAEKVEEFSTSRGRKHYLIAESDLNDSRIIKPRKAGGFGLDAQWCDDFHHAVHTLLTGENRGYYIDFGETEHVVKSLREGFVYSGQYSEYRKRNHGNSSENIPASQLIVFSQNHDQVGNRMLGERLSVLVSFEALKLAAGAVLLSAYIPLLFMGQEYGENAPFLYFVNHSDTHLIEAVRKGRKEEFKTFLWKEEPPDPQAVETFLKSKINWEKRKEGEHKVLLDFYKSLIKLRRDISALSNLEKKSLKVSEFEDKKVLLIKRRKDKSEVFVIFNFNNTDMEIKTSLTGRIWKKILDSSEKVWHGPGTLLPEEISRRNEIMVRSQSVALYMKDNV